MATQFPGQFPGQQSNQMVARIKRLLLSPASEWAAIDTEAMTTTQILMGWVIPLAAIGPIAQFIGSVLFGYSLLGFHYQPSLGMAIGTAASSYVLGIIALWVIAIVINALAPSFGGTKSSVQAMKVAAFSMTAAWLAGIFAAVPSISFLGIVGLYSLYLLYLGLPRLMQATDDKAMPYTLAVILVTIVAMVVTSAVARTIGGQFASPMGVLGSGNAGSIGGIVTLPNGGSVDLGKLNDATRKIQAASDAIKAGKGAPAVPAASLAAMLPASLSGWKRTEIESQSGGAAGFNGSHAEARYEYGDDSFRLSVTDISALGALAGMGGALHLQSNKQTATGYETTQMIDGRMVSEKWHSDTKSGSFGMMVANRFMVEASGSAPSIDTLKGAVAAVDPARLEVLAQ